VILVTGYYAGDYDGVDHDTSFFAIMLALYTLTCLTIMAYFRSNLIGVRNRGDLQ
jgi:hypothetical protein